MKAKTQRKTRPSPAPRTVTRKKPASPPSEDAEVMRLHMKTTFADRKRLAELRAELAQVGYVRPLSDGQLARWAIRAVVVDKDSPGILDEVLSDDRRRKS